MCFVNNQWYIAGLVAWGELSTLLNVRNLKKKVSNFRNRMWQHKCSWSLHKCHQLHKLDTDDYSSGIGAYNLKQMMIKTSIS